MLSQLRGRAPTAPRGPAAGQMLAGERTTDSPFLFRWFRPRWWTSWQARACAGHPRSPSASGKGSGSSTPAESESLAPGSRGSRIRPAGRPRASAMAHRAADPASLGAKYLLAPCPRRVQGCLRRTAEHSPPVLSLPAAQHDLRTHGFEQIRQVFGLLPRVIAQQPHRLLPDPLHPYPCSDNNRTGGRQIRSFPRLRHPVSVDVGDHAASSLLLRILSRGVTRFQIQLLNPPREG